MNARSLFLTPVLALFVALSGCDAGAPSTEGLQTSPNVPTANVIAISGPSTLYPNCQGLYTPDTGGLDDPARYWSITGGATIVSQASNGAYVLAGSTSPSTATLYFHAGNGSVLGSKSILIKTIVPPCEY